MVTYLTFMYNFSDFLNANLNLNNSKSNTYRKWDVYNTLPKGNHNDI